ncbi:MAG: hypothetical protein HYX69_18690 [Planctomycetia bacterium]|nr:hypothetical protein [Planctomycetia bacterium]
MNRVGWRDAFRRLSLAYGWSPDQIASLTPAQLWSYIDPSGPLAGWKMMSPAAARAYRNQKRMERQDSIGGHARSQ